MNTSRLESVVCRKRSVSRNLIGFVLTLVLTLLPFQIIAREQTKQLSSRTAIVVDERLSVLRSAPDHSAPLVRRIGRGRRLAVVGSHRSRDGVLFYRVAVTRRTRGWIQREALIVPKQRGADERLVRLIQASADFDRIARARIFLEAFPRSSLRPAVLLLFGDDAAKVARKLSADATRRLDEREMEATGANFSSYFLNYNGLDRYRKLGIGFTFESATRQFQYDGATWRELLRRYPTSAEAAEARERLGKMGTAEGRSQRAVGRKQWAK